MPKCPPRRRLLLLLSLWGLLPRRAEALRGRRRESCTSAGNATAGSVRRPWRPRGPQQASPVTGPSICTSAGTTLHPTPLPVRPAPGICPGTSMWPQALSSASVAVMANGDLGETILSVRTQRTMGPFRRLRCTRNYIHINLFTSFMLRAAAILTRDRLLPPPGPSPGDQAPPLWNQALAACRTAQIMTQYCVGANYTWLLVEGIYLHSLLVGVGGSEGGHFRCYLLLGWGVPALFVIPWVIVRYLYENTQCWERNDVKAIWWIIRTPILMTILINFFIFIRILGILLSKLRTRQMRCPDYRLRLARSTLTLVPLLGVHEVVFAPVTEEQARGALRLAKLGFEIFFSSFQGLLVSVLYCFINKEVGRTPARRPCALAAAQRTARWAPPLSAVPLQVQSEIRRGWHRCRLRRSLSEGQRQPPKRASGTLPLGSGPSQVATGRTLSSGTLPVPRDEASRVLESYC
ncbi:gastric inhibitory polypeptide receptor isoform X8 [Rousettus aegyptiacus]|nr:gastric inhibitory polypeptide receptor isoform X8 [Rousettus aegyptiacus]